MRINALQQATAAITKYETRPLSPYTDMEEELAAALIRLRIETLEVMGVLAQAMLDDEVGKRVIEIGKAATK